MEPLTRFWYVDINLAKSVVIYVSVSHRMTQVIGIT